MMASAREPSRCSIASSTWQCWSCATTSLSRARLEWACPPQRPTATQTAGSRRAPSRGVMIGLSANSSSSVEVAVERHIGREALVVQLGDREHGIDTGQGRSCGLGQHDGGRTALGRQGGPAGLPACRATRWRQPHRARKNSAPQSRRWARPATTPPAPGAPGQRGWGCATCPSSTIASSAMRMPPGNSPERIHSRSCNCVRTVCDCAALSSARSAATLNGAPFGLRPVPPSGSIRTWGGPARSSGGAQRNHSGALVCRRLGLDLGLDHPPRPHRAGVDVEVVELLSGFSSIARCCASRMTSSSRKTPATPSRSSWSGAAREASSCGEGPEVVAGRVGLGRHGVEHDSR